MRISRSKVDLFIQCPLCFWLDTKVKVKRPSGPPFSLNIAVDHLFKNEFDNARGKAVPMRLAKEGLSFTPADHPKLELWRNNFKGVTRIFGSPAVEFFGSIDDLWQDMFGQYYVVDYKATSKVEDVSLDADWQIAYKRQVEFYQWLLRGNDLDVSDQAWFVYTNGIKDERPFEDVLHFKTKMLSYNGNGDWIEPTLKELIACVHQDQPPQASDDCPYCQFVDKRLKFIKTPKVTVGKVADEVSIDKRISRKAVASARTDSDQELIFAILEEKGGRYLIDDLVIEVLKRSGKKVLTYQKRKVLDTIFQLQKDKLLSLENGMAALV
jgi:hypothetical protein